MCLWLPDNLAVPCGYPIEDKFFQGKCYFSKIVSGFTEATTACGQCGHLASIHSLGQNNFVAEIGNQQSVYYSILGLQETQSSYAWLDGSFFDYSNFGHENRSIGECISLALANEEVPPGQWINSQCSGNGLVAVCQKNVTNICDQPTGPSTITPMKCDGPLFYLNTGMIYSPGYPYGSIMSCEYVITEDESQTAWVRFDDLALNGSTIALYSTFFNSPPFYYVNSSSNIGKVIISPTNILKILYNSIGKGPARWSLEYGGNYSTPTTTSKPTSPTTTTLPLKPLSCSFVLDWSYLGSPFVSNETYIKQRDLMNQTAYLLFISYGIQFSTNFAAYGYVTNPSQMELGQYFPSLDEFSAAEKDFIPMNGSPTSVCDMIAHINKYNIPSGTSNPCLVFFSAETTSEFQRCSILIRTKFNGIIGGMLNEVSGVSGIATQTVAISEDFNYQDAANLANTILNVMINNN